MPIWAGDQVPLAVLTMGCITMGQELLASLVRTHLTPWGLLIHIEVVVRLAKHLVHIDTAVILRLVIIGPVGVQLRKEPSIFLQTLGHYEGVFFLSFLNKLQMLLLLQKPGRSLMRV